MKQRLFLSLALSLCMASMLANGIYYVKDFGAKGDGKALDHIAINKAIEAATNAGGGQVVLSPGTYLCGSIRLKSNVDLHLMAGAKILAAPGEMKVYDESESFGGFPEYQDGGHTVPTGSPQAHDGLAYLLRPDGVLLLCIEAGIAGPELLLVEPGDHDEICNRRRQDLG